MAVLAPTFPAPFPSNIKSIRFYETGVATANFADNKWPFQRVDPANPAIPEQGWSHTILIRADSGGGDLEISFDGTNVHGFCPGGGEVYYQNRYEGGISVRGAGTTFHVEAW
jgi:hypothetical protein